MYISTLINGLLIYSSHLLSLIHLLYSVHLLYWNLRDRYTYLLSLTVYWYILLICCIWNLNFNCVLYSVWGLSMKCRSPGLGWANGAVGSTSALFKYPGCTDPSHPRLFSHKLLNPARPKLWLRERVVCWTKNKENHAFKYYNTSLKTTVGICSVGILP